MCDVRGCKNPPEMTIPSIDDKKDEYRVCKICYDKIVENRYVMEHYGEYELSRIKKGYSWR
jgi:hypothetical protein